MSKRIGKRRKQRHNELREMAVISPDRFLAVWIPKLESWCGEVLRPTVFDPALVRLSPDYCTPPT